MSSTYSRHKLINGSRDISPCNVCDVKGTLIGAKHVDAWNNKYEKEKKFKLGTWITSFNPDSLEIIASFKFDWIAVDLEHSTISFEQLSIMISIIQKTGTEAWVRVGKK